MKFRTEIDITPLESKISHLSRILTLGSCFASEIGERLREGRFNAEVNPSGVLFNPASICRAIERFSNNEFVSLDELKQGAQGWFHYDFHSSLSAVDKEECLCKINSAIECGHRALSSADWVLLTLGTAWVYELSCGGGVVASCHKQPHSTFHRRRMSTTEIASLLVQSIKKHLPNKRVILTLSPIRHTGDGLQENCLSKSTLRVAIEEVTSALDNCYYFPAYEILVDDLRDYRFYGRDMVHPAPIAVEYVHQRFVEFAISPLSLPIMERVEKIVRALKHLPLNPSSKAYQEFCAQQLVKIAELDGVVELEEERRYFQSMMM